MPREEASDPMAIDPDRLDREWLLQAQLTRRIGYAEAEARHVYNQAKTQLDVAEARIKLEVARNPTKFGLDEKAKVGEVAAAVRLDKRYRELEDAAAEAAFALDVLKVDSLACLDRRKALERLVELIALDYHAERGEPRARTEAAKQYRAASAEATKRDVLGGGHGDD